MVGERVVDRLNKKPVWTEVDDRIADQMHDVRNTPGNSFRQQVPRLGKRNLGDAIGLGLIEAGIAVVLEEVVGVPFGADVDVNGVNPVDDGVIYTVNVNAPTENMARARAFIDAGTGFTAILTDELDVRGIEIVSKRSLRDTYQIQVKIKE